MNQAGWIIIGAIAGITLLGATMLTGCGIMGYGLWYQPISPLYFGLTAGLLIIGIVTLLKPKPVNRTGGPQE